MRLSECSRRVEGAQCNAHRNDIWSLMSRRATRQKRGALHIAFVICILQKKPYMQVSFCHDFRIAGSLRAEVSHPISCKSRWRERAPHHFLQRIVSTPKFSYLFLSLSLALVVPLRALCVSLGPCSAGDRGGAADHRRPSNHTRTAPGYSEKSLVWGSFKKDTIEIAQTYIVVITYLLSALSFC